MTKTNKKKKKLARSQKIVACGMSTSNSILEDIIENLILIKGSGGLVIGTNAVLRGIEKQSVNVVILITSRATSAMFHAVKLSCKNNGALFFPFNNKDLNALNSKIHVSTTYGIKIGALSGNAEISDLVNRLKQEIEIIKSKMERKKTLSLEQITPSHDQLMGNAESAITLSFVKHEISCDDYVPHAKHAFTNPKRIGNAEMFISLDEYTISEPDFPDYKTGLSQPCPARG